MNGLFSSLCFSILCKKKNLFRRHIYFRKYKKIFCLPKLTKEIFLKISEMHYLKFKKLMMNLWKDIFVSYY